MKIEHQSHFDGDVQTLAHIEGDRVVKTVGILAPGKYQFRSDHPILSITVTSGRISLNAGASIDHGELPPIAANKPFELMAYEASTYVCTHG